MSTNKISNLFCAIFYSAILFGASLAFSDNASAQQVLSNQRQDNYTKVKKRAKGKTIKSGDLDSLGYQLMDGVVLMPDILIEGGYDSNHDELFAPDSSPFALIAGSTTLGYIQPGQSILLTVKGTYDNLSGLARENRWDAGLSLDTYYRLADGLEYTGGLFYFYDELSLAENETYSSFSQLEYTTSDINAYIKTESYKTRYIKATEDLSAIPLAQLPFFRDPVFNIERHEISGGAIYRPHGLVGIYGSGGFAAGDYTDQPDETQIDRDYNEFWLIGGVRINWSPHLRTELGWRYNERDMEDLFIGKYDNNGFDAKITWAPNAILAVTFEADNYLSEPSSAFSLVSDVQRYTITVNIQPTTRSQIEVYASNEVRREIGTGEDFREDSIGAEYGYMITPNGQLYINALYSRTQELSTFTEYDRFKIGVGFKTSFVRNEGELGPDINLVDKLLPGVRLVETRIGYSRLFLPSTDMVAVTNLAFTQTLFNRTNHDGELDGARIDFRIPGFASIRTSPELGRLGLGERDMTFNFAGYYGRYQSSQDSVCNSVLLVNHCTFFNILDPQAFVSNNTGPFGQLAISTDRDVDIWGFSLDTFIFGTTQPSNLPQPYLLGAMPNPPRHQHAFRAGLAIKAIQQRTELFAVETAVPDPVDYVEDLDTFYYGGYIGFDKLIDMGRGFSLNLNAEAGVYYANTNYKGNYLGYIDLGGPGPYVLDRGLLQLSDNDISFIGSLRIELNKQLSMGTFGIYAEGEYYSYLPRVLYNNTDLDGGGIFDIFGPNSATGFADDEAYSYTFGARSTIPLN